MGVTRLSFVVCRFLLPGNINLEESQHQQQYDKRQTHNITYQFKLIRALLNMNVVLFEKETIVNMDGVVAI